MGKINRVVIFGLCLLSLFIGKASADVNGVIAESVLLSESGQNGGKPVAVDGNTLFVGLPDNGGLVQMYQYDGTEWQFVTDMQSPVAKEGQEFEKSLAFRDGLLAVGAPACGWCVNSRCCISIQGGWEYTHAPFNPAA